MTWEHEEEIWLVDESTVPQSCFWCGGPLHQVAVATYELGDDHELVQDYVAHRAAWWARGLLASQLHFWVFAGPFCSRRCRADAESHDEVAPFLKMRVCGFAR